MSPDAPAGPAVVSREEAPMPSRPLPWRLLVGDSVLVIRATERCLDSSAALALRCLVLHEAADTFLVVDVTPVEEIGAGVTSILRAIHAARQVCLVQVRTAVAMQLAEAGIAGLIAGRVLGPPPAGHRG